MTMSERLERAKRNGECFVIEAERTAQVATARLQANCQAVIDRKDRAEQARRAKIGEGLWYMQLDLA